jgi:predicted alpha/beta-hydrolase family hydrolase
MTETWRVQSGPDETSVAWDPPAEGDPRAVFVCAHGAGGNMQDGAVRAVADVLRARGIGVVRFNFFYTARGSGRPDPMPRLLDCWTAVLDSVRARLAPATLVIGGRSMGGRAASMLAAEGAAIDGLLLLAYPLHPPGHPEKIRSAHLPAIAAPVLCINGTRDPFCDPPLMSQTLTGLGPNWQMHWLQEADHSFHVLKRSGRTHAQVLDEVADVCDAWVARL